MSAPDPLRARRLERRLLAAIVASALLLMLLGIGWGLPNVEPWNGDDISPGKPLRVVHDWWQGHHKYPYLHWWLNALLYLPWLAVVAVLGQVDLGCLPRLRPECFAHPERDMTVFMVLSRLLSAAMGVGIVLGTRRLALALTGDRLAGLMAAAIAAWSPVLIFFCQNANLDVPHVFWFTWSLPAALAVWQRGAPFDYLAFGALAGCAIATKDPIVGAYVLPGVALLGVHVRRVAGEGGGRGAALARRALLDRRLLGLVALVVGIYAVVQNAVFNFEGLLAHFASWTDESLVLADLRSRGRGPWHFLWRLAVSLEAELGWPMLLLCGAGALYAALFERRALVLALPVVSYFCFTLLPAFVEPRLVLPLLPLLAVWGGLLASRLLRLRAPLRAAAATLLALALAYEFAVSLNGDLRLLADSRYQAEAWIEENVPEGTRFAALGGSRFLPRIERMGYSARWFGADEIRPGPLEESGLEWVLLSGMRHPAMDRAYHEALGAGRRGYSVVFESDGGHPLPRWFETRLRPGAVSPRVTILRRPAPQRPGAANR